MEIRLFIEQFAEVLDCPAHIGCEGVLIVIPGNDLDFGVAVADRKDGCLCGIKQRAVGHDGNEDGLVGDCRFNCLRIDKTVFIDIEIGDFSSFALQIIAGMENGVMLDLRRDDVVSLVGISLEGGLEGPVVGFGSAGREIDFFRIGTDYMINAFVGKGLSPSEASIMGTAFNICLMAGGFIMIVAVVVSITFFVGSFILPETGHAKTEKGANN